MSTHAPGTGPSQEIPGPQTVDRESPEAVHAAPEPEAEPRQASDGTGSGRLAAFLVLAVLATLSLIWLAAESHYQGCVQAVEALYGPEVGNLEALARREGVENCSRLPF